METIEFISLLALIQNPEMFDGQLVRVIGLCSFGFETNAMWGATEYYNQSLTKNAIWLALPDGMDMSGLHGKVMLVEGVFSAQDKGHLGLYSGSIDKITRIEPWQE